MTKLKTQLPKFKLMEGHQMKLAFELGGIPYYEFTDSNMAPCERMFAAMDFYNEFNMRCTREYLMAHSTALREQLSGKNGSVDLVNVQKLQIQLEERLEWIFEPESAYKYASVMFVDENEDPYSYDFKYNKEKIALWKKETPSSFFLTMPVARLFPPLNISKQDFQDYLNIQKKIGTEHLATIFTMLSKEHKTKDWYNTLELLKAEGLPFEK